MANVIMFLASFSFVAIEILVEVGCARTISPAETGGLLGLFSKPRSAFRAGGVRLARR